MIEYEGTNMVFVDKTVTFVQWIISIVRINKNASPFFLLKKERGKLWEERERERERERDACFHTMAIDCTNAAVVGLAAPWLFVSDRYTTNI